MCVGGATLAPLPRQLSQHHVSVYDAGRAGAVGLAAWGAAEKNRCAWEGRRWRPGHVVASPRLSRARLLRWKHHQRHHVSHRFAEAGVIRSAEPLRGTPTDSPGMLGYGNTRCFYFMQRWQGGSSGTNLAVTQGVDSAYYAGVAYADKSCLLFWSAKRRDEDWTGIQQWNLQSGNHFYSNRFRYMII